MPASDGSDNFVRISGPSEGLRLGIVFDDEAIDGGLQVDDRDEDAALQSPLGEFCEEAFDGVEPRARCWREVECEALVPIEPSSHIGMLVSGVVVEDHMHGFAGRHLRLDRVEEADKLLMTMALHIASDHGSVEHIEGGKQRCGAVALVVVGHRSSTSLLQRKTRLSAIEGLNLAFLIERQDNSVRGRIDIEADHIAQLIDELRIVRKFELANPMGLEPMRQQPMALHARRSLIPWASTR